MWELVETESAERDSVESGSIEVLGENFGTSGISEGKEVLSRISGITWGKTKLYRYEERDKVGEGMDARGKMCS